MGPPGVGGDQLAWSRRRHSFGLKLLEKKPIRVMYSNTIEEFAKKWEVSKLTWSKHHMEAVERLAKTWTIPTRKSSFGHGQI
ncbi:hypothetical protein KXD40_003624 [Peronospora effusa]|nr:hypothetical protein KXD40_003624 [Peronospora effusa]